MHISRRGSDRHTERPAGRYPGLHERVGDVPEELAWNVDPYFSTPVDLGHKFTLWTPTAPGEHSLMAYETSAGGPIRTVTVNPATPLGPGCIVAP
ncbi:hypothetical protein [Rhodococcus sp. ARC_M5]|uniref:hypothetical protein n=1 Tax=Rhodococcus sp. ARC_M5 TaxID=2928851 RepID=UPI001FB4B9FA|nr:hypothetical protein [Rhodococcus sp. ARC_M5]MCJ0895046.1 hypothetical protein [Rhodococcus sp. ARC_M5]